MNRLILAFGLLCGVAWGTACPAGYSNWTSVTIPHNASLSGNLSNFPYPLVSSSSTTVPLIGFVFCTGNNSGTLLNYELVSGNKEWWVSVPTISTSVDQTIWFGGKPSGTDLSNAAGVFPIDLAMHFGSSGSLVLTDSTGNNTITNTGALVAGSGLINGGADYGGGGRFLSTNHPNATTTVTVECWINDSDISSVQFCASNAGDGNGYGLYIFNSGITMQVWSGSSESDYRCTSCGLTTTGWHYIVGQYNGGNATLTSSYKLYIDGVSQTGSMIATGTSSMGTATQNLQIGAKASGNDYFHLLDEPEVTAAITTADWIAEKYQANTNPISITLPASIGSSHAFPAVF